ncbi:mechanosensitive ion channel family protein [Weissella paramesenteroides]|uniref:mechanosensitive ion channel family protein n=1 Tax=Weissella paramesenteroides TaxID=1249 RepID=UPI00388E91CF
MKLLQKWLINNFDWQALGLALLIIILTIIVTKGIVGVIFYQIEKRLSKRFAIWRDVLVAFEKPVKIAILFAGFVWALHTARAPHLILQYVDAINKSVVMFSVGYGLYSLMSSLTDLFQYFGAKIHVEVDSIVMPFLKRTLQFVVMALTITMILSDWGINVNGVFAGLGLAGLAVSMAAQDPIKNLLGGIIIITEKPFQIGDNIESPSVAGIAEDITFRSTLVRTLDGALVVVPNATLSNEPITNWSRVEIRKIPLVFYLSLKTDTKELIAVSEETMRKLLVDDRFEEGTAKAFINQVTPYGYEFNVNVFLKMLPDTDFPGARADVNMIVLRILAAHNIQLSVNTKQMPQQ